MIVHFKYYRDNVTKQFVSFREKKTLRTSENGGIVSQRKCISVCDI